MTILLIEDDGPTREMFREVLVNDGHSVTAVNTLSAAYLALGGRQFDLIVTDGQVPWLEGGTPESTAPAIRNICSQFRIPVMACTGNPVIAPELGAAGCDPVLIKPVALIELLQAIRPVSS